MKHLNRMRYFAQVNQMLIDQLVNEEEQCTSLSFNISRIAKYGRLYNVLTAHNCIALPAWDTLGYPSPTHCDFIPSEVLHNDRRKLPRITQPQAW